VLHTCDNSLCVRPRHIYLGIVADNTRDMLARKRHPSVLVEDEVVRYIRDTYIRASRERGAKALALELGLSYTTVYNIATGRKYRWVK